MRRANVSVPGATAFPLLLMAVVVLLLLLPSHVHAADIPEQEFIDLRVRWRTRLMGSLDYDRKDADIRTVIDALDASVTNGQKRGFWDTMNKDASRTTLWPDTDDEGKAAHMTESYKRLRDMALVYITDSSVVYLNTELKEDIVSALDWMYENRFNERKSQMGLWWDWEINTPLLLNDITVLMYDELTESQRKNYMNAVNHFVPDPTVRQSSGGKETGSDLANKALICVIAGIIDKSSDTIFKGQAAVSGVLEYVTSGNGFYEDGSFIYHNHVAYTGSYGAVALAAVANTGIVLGDSRWRITDPNLQNVYRWVKESIVPFIYHGAMMDSVRGVSISRSKCQDHAVGRQVVMGIMRLSAVAEPRDAFYLKRLVKRWVTEDTTFANYYLGLDLADAVVLKTIMSDSSIPLQDELFMSRVYPAMARAVHRQPGYGFAVSMFSPRVTAFEYGNGENRKGWYTGMGMTTLYNSDVSQFSEDYWATVDMNRLPGTTIFETPPEVPMTAWHLYANTKTWVGGATLDDEFSAVGMEFDQTEVVGMSLHGRKSWFMFRKEIVCVGSDINGKHPEDYSVETIVENRRLRNNGNKRVMTVNGVVMPESGWGGDWFQSRYAHLTGDDESSGIGYYFPRGAIVHTLRETRTHSWMNVNLQEDAQPLYTNSFLSIRIPHRANPKDATYCYVLLPGKTAAQVEDYMQNPTITVLYNWRDAHVVEMKEREVDMYTVTAGNFWSPYSVEFFSAKTPLSVIVKEDEYSGTMHVAICDPTQTQDAISVELRKSDFVLVSKDPDVHVIIGMNSIVIDVDTAGAQGATFHAVFRKE